jgi:hypothetical protein
MKGIWTGEPNEKQKEQRDFVLRHMLYSCHGKTKECDGGGQALKGNLSNAEKTGDGYFDRALRIVEWMRANLVDAKGRPAKTDFFKSTGSGVYLLYVYHITLRRPGSINRRDVVLASDQHLNIVLMGNARTAFQIGTIHRMPLTVGYRQPALAAARCCQDCDRCEDGMYESCKRSDECKRQGVPFSEGMASYELKEINIEAKAQKKNQYTSAGINLLSNLVFDNAAPVHILAITAPRLQKRCTKMDVRIFAGGGGCTNFWWWWWWWCGGVGARVFSGFACRGGAASTEIARWGAAGCPAIGAGRPDKWA